MAKKALANARQTKQSVPIPDEQALRRPNTYRLKFLPKAKEEWDKLDGSLQLQF